MVTPAERMKGWIESLSESWKECLRGWMASWLSWGIEVFFNVLSKAAAPKLKPLIDNLEATNKIPPELQPLLNEIKEPTGQIGAMFAQSAGGALIGGALGKIIDAAFLPIAYAYNQKTLNVMLTLDQYLAAWLRGKMPNSDLKTAMEFMGLPEYDHSILKELTQIRLDPASWITAFRRRYENFDKIKDDLKHQGWDDDRIEALKFFTLYYPSPAELIHWTAREVFEPDMVKKYGLRTFPKEFDREIFYKAGMDDEQIDNHWIAHWEHASWMQIIEMLHRKIISEQDVKDWFPLVEIAPYWAENLIKVAYTWPTRVDVRRWWDMRTIGEARLRELYEGMGYRDKNLDDYVLWTKVYVDFPSLIARFQKGWITEDDVRSELKKLGMPADRIETMLQEKIAPEKPAQVEQDRQATATEIMKGVKTELISWTQGVEMLGDIGYASDVAEFKLAVYLGLAGGSPETYPEFKQLTQAYRKAVGLPMNEVPQEIIEASKVYRDARDALKGAETQNLTDAELAPYLKTMNDAEYHYRALLTKWEAEKKK